MPFLAFAGKAAGYLVSGQAFTCQKTEERICRADFGRSAPDAVPLWGKDQEGQAGYRPFPQ